MTTEQPSLGTGIRVLAARGAGGWRDGSGAVDLMLAARGAEGWRDGRATAALRSDKLSGRCCGGRGAGGSVGGRITRGVLPRPLKIEYIYNHTCTYIYRTVFYRGGRLHEILRYLLLRERAEAGGEVSRSSTSSSSAFDFSEA